VNLNLDAQTVHSLAGIKVPSQARDFGTMMARYQAKKWRKLEVLVIDEVGMLTADFLDWLDVHVRRIRVSFFPSGRCSNLSLFAQIPIQYFRMLH
jgi:ATP-dependent exoDNAse (exonuclease V) alpha subunit